MFTKTIRLLFALIALAFPPAALSLPPPSGLSVVGGQSGAIPTPISIPDPDYQTSIPIGMNLPSLNYYAPATVFTDGMKASSPPFTSTSDQWNTNMMDQIDVDQNGYPTSVPQQTSDGREPHIRFLVNNYYQGRYRVYYEGLGALGGNVLIDPQGYYIDLTGQGTNKWIDIVESQTGDHIRNIRIIPERYSEADSYPLFHEAYLNGLRPFHALRFMDWSKTNATDYSTGSIEVHWTDRPLPDDFTQGGERGVADEYAVALSNELGADAWICVPHMASDDAIRQLAQLWWDNLDPGLKVYVEYSNEIWNFQFSQAHWIVNNAPGAVDAYVSGDLLAIGPAGSSHPEKDAYMMARVFRIWEEVFGSGGRAVFVATGQHGWPGNTERILRYLFETDGIGADVMAVGGYFGFTEDYHQEWLSSCGLTTPETFYEAAYAYIVDGSSSWTRETAEYINRYGVDYMVYEGGQHMQPYRQDEWCYNDALYDFQIHPYMYDLYFHNFNVHAESEVECKLFMAYNYAGPRESKYGSWGHLESLDQVGTSYSYAPKFRALVDANVPR